MPGCFLYIWLFFFVVFVREFEVKEVKTGLYSRVELTGEKLDQHIADSLQSVEWTKQKKECLCFRKDNTSNTSYSQCCGTANFYSHNNTLILENVTAQDEGIFSETIVLKNGTIKHLNFTLTIQYPPNATEIVVSWTSNTSVTLKCNVSGSFLHLMWMREGVPIIEKHRHSFRESNQTLHISNITSSDYGTYSCIASNEYGESKTHTNITGEYSTVNQENGTSGNTDQSNQTVLLSGLAVIGVLGVCTVFCCLHKYHHRQRAENGRTTDEGGADNDIGIYQEVPGTEEVTPLPYVYTDFIKPKESSQASAAAQHFEDFGYSEVGDTCREQTVVLEDFGYSEVGLETVALYCVSKEQSTACPDAEEE
ncbi:hypothetical protein Q8A67_023606 [Cirrhinus molitorella]|uniref:Ig-like domain-containing protein n=1 Tax=Cirrhinus molitorella TaxID=172907 RepID=A0AA88P264_9TELE|nr:hypothetical protein Q8A67_023606 [Cirrhinus molitorella]